MHPRTVSAVRARNEVANTASTIGSENGTVFCWFRLPIFSSLVRCMVANVCRVVLSSQPVLLFPVNLTHMTLQKP